MQANRDKTTKMTQEGGAEQQPNIPTQTVEGTMKPVDVKKAASMKLCKGESYNRGKI